MGVAIERAACDKLFAGRIFGYHLVGIADNGLNIRIHKYRIGDIVGNGCICIIDIIDSANNLVCCCGRFFRPREYDCGVAAGICTRFRSTRTRVNGYFPNGFVHYETRFAALGLGFCPALYPDGYVIVAVILQILICVPRDGSRIGRRGQSEIVRSNLFRLGRIGRCQCERLHRKGSAVSPCVGLSAFCRGFGGSAGGRVRDFNRLEGEVQRLLTLRLARGGVGVLDTDGCVPIQRVGCTRLSDCQFVEGLVCRHDIRVFAEVAVACRIREVLRVIRLDITVAADAVLVGLAGLYLVLDFPVADEDPIVV